MENKTSNENKVICRKCGGPHFTIKCGKEKTELVPAPAQIGPMEKQEKHNQANQTNQTKPNEKVVKYSSNKPSQDNMEQEFRPRQEKKYFKVTFRVKLSELPTDMTEEELMEMTTDWGHIVRIKLLVYEESSTAYIDFGYEDEADYFVEAIDKTPFEFRVISACRVESFRVEKPQDH